MEKDEKKKKVDFKTIITLAIAIFKFVKEVIIPLCDGDDNTSPAEIVPNN